MLESVTIDDAGISQDTWTEDEWNALTWLEKLNHNMHAWASYFKGKQTQWWSGRRWCDEPMGSKDFQIVNIEHPMRIKPETT